MSLLTINRPLPQIFVQKAEYKGYFWDANRKLLRMGIIWDEQEHDTFIVTTDRHVFSARFTALDGSAISRLKDGNFKAVCMSLPEKRLTDLEITAPEGKIILPDVYFLIPHPATYREAQGSWSCPYPTYYKRLVQATGEYLRAAIPQIRHNMKGGGCGAAPAA